MTALFIGATGMLRAAARHRLDVAGSGILLSRHADASLLADMFGAAASRCTAAAADWRDENAFRATLGRCAAAHGPFSEALVWMHGRSPALRDAVCEALADGAKLVEVLGSAASRPGAFGDQRLAEMRARPQIRYTQVLLGFVVEDRGSRWLTHGEISQRALDAFETDEPRLVAGQVEPWDRRPA